MSVIAVTRPGAADSVPTLEEVLEAELDADSGGRALRGELFFLPEEDYRALCAQTGAEAGLVLFSSVRYKSGREAFAEK